MQSELRSLSKNFSETIFRIPDYQRGYSWQIKQLKDFWSDIEQLPSGSSHYTGVLTLEPTGKDDYQSWEDDLWIIESKKYTPLYVVDGQQRLTTAIILMQALLDILPDGAEMNFTSRDEIRKKYIFESKDKGISRSYLFGYEKDNPSYEFLKTHVFGEQSENHSLSEETIYTKNLQDAKSFFAERLRGKGIAELESIFTKLTQHVQFNIFFIEPELDVFVTFETMNNRGKALSHLELLKNRLIYLSTKFEADPADTARLRRTINESWKTIYHYLGKLNDLSVNDDSFLETHFTTYFGPQILAETDDDEVSARYRLHRFTRGDEYKDFLLDEIFSTKRIWLPANEGRLTLAEVNDYAKDIKATVKLYHEVLAPENSDFPDEDRKHLARLSKLGNAHALLLALVAVRKLTASTARTRLLCATERRTFLSRFRSYSFADVSVDELAVRLMSDEMTAEEVTRIFDEQSTKFAASGDFQDSLRGIGKQQGYYGWAALRYFMYEYEQELRTLSKTDRQLLNWEEYSAEIFESDHRTIEHIYPQRVSDPYWKAKFASYTVPERNQLRNSLGNLLPVSHAKNASLSNSAFSKKRGNSSNQVGYSYGCLSEIQVAQEADWSALQILSRGVHLLNFLESRWEVTIGDDERKIEVLGLAFVPSREGVSLQTASAAFAAKKPVRRAVRPPTSQIK